MALLRQNLGWKMLGVLLFAALAVIGAIAGRAVARWRIDSRVKTDQVRESVFRKEEEPASGRIEFVSGIELASTPTEYDGKRIIVSGIWSQGFEHSLLQLDGAEQRFLIWVESDIGRITAPMGDFSRSHGFLEDVASPHRTVRHIVAEGTFHYRRRGTNGLGAYGHMNCADGFFLIDRLLEYEPTDNTPNQSPQRNAGAGPAGSNEAPPSRPASSSEETARAHSPRG